MWVQPTSLNKLGGYLMILGGLVALAFFWVQPGVLFIDRVGFSDAKGSVAAAAANPELAGVSAMMIGIGLVMSTFGLYAVLARISDGGSGDAWLRAGFTLLVVGYAGWFLAQGTVIIFAAAQDPQALAVAETLHAVKTALTLISGVAVTLGFFLFSLAIAPKCRGYKLVVALVVAVVSLVAFGCYAVGIVFHDLLDALIGIARIGYLAWVVWGVILGLELLKAESAAD